MLKRIDRIQEGIRVGAKAFNHLRNGKITDDRAWIICHYPQSESETSLAYTLGEGFFLVNKERDRIATIHPNDFECLSDSAFETLINKIAESVERRIIGLEEDIKSLQASKATLVTILKIK